MKVLILGANGFLGPHVVKALEGDYALRLTDIKEPPDTTHEFIHVDASDLEAVVAAAEGMDAIVNLSVLRYEPKLAFDVNTRGTFNALTAAVEHGIRRVINTGPFFAVTGPDTVEQFDFGIHTDVPHQPGTFPYAITKGLGEEICRIFTEHHDLYVSSFLFYHFRYAKDRPGDEREFIPFSVMWDDAGALFPLALDISLESLPSRYETYFVSADLPQGQFSNDKVKRDFGWQPTHNFERFWRKSAIS
jgi:nucleoside-diphosphate-sugar epimerase